MYLSYTGFKMVTTCQFQYWLVYVAQHTPCLPDDRLGSIYGSAIGRVFEDFYRLKVWKKGPECRDALHNMVPSIVDEVIAEAQMARKGRPAGVLMWRDEDHPEALYANREEIISDVQSAIPPGLDTIKTHRLLGKDAVAEMKLDCDIGGHRIGGRADFVMTRLGFGDLVIIDGKGSKHRDKYLDPRQLLWYSMLYWTKYGKFPDWSGFLLWKRSPPLNVKKYVFDTSDAEALREEILSVVREIDAKREVSRSLPVVRESFRPSVSEDNCRFCLYAHDRVCPEGSEVRRKINERRQGR